MRNCLYILSVIFLFASCHKLKGEEIEPYLGKWKCKGFIIGDHTYSPVYEVLEPYEECYMEITKGSVIFTNHGEKLKVYVISFEFEEYYQVGGDIIQPLIIKTRDIKGQKRELLYCFKDGYLRGSFFSKNGFTENVDWSNWNNLWPLYYEYHQFEKL